MLGQGQVAARGGDLHRASTQRAQRVQLRCAQRLAVAAGRRALPVESAHQLITGRIRHIPLLVAGKRVQQAAPRRDEIGLIEQLVTPLVPYAAFRPSIAGFTRVAKRVLAQRILLRPRVREVEEVVVGDGQTDQPLFSRRLPP
jgi:hypothetical protein